MLQYFCSGVNMHCTNPESVQKNRKTNFDHQRPTVSCCPSLYCCNEVPKRNLEVLKRTRPVSSIFKIKKVRYKALQKMAEAA